MNDRNAFKILSIGDYFFSVPGAGDSCIFALTLTLCRSTVATQRESSILSKGMERIPVWNI
jgi:hypothetical protein